MFHYKNLRLEKYVESTLICKILEISLLAFCLQQNVFMIKGVLKLELIVPHACFVEDLKYERLLECCNKSGAFLSLACSL